jgi:DNA-binding NarL/FixJ family response regulator
MGSNTKIDASRDEVKLSNCTVHGDRINRRPLSLTYLDKVTVRLAVDGAGYRDIAIQMKTTEQTIKNRMKTIFTKTGAGTRAELTSMVWEHPEWIDAPKCDKCGRMMQAGSVEWKEFPR